MLTLTDLQEKLKSVDEISLMEILDISSEDLVQRFLDRIEERYDDLSEDFSEEDCDDYVYSREEEQDYLEVSEWN